MKEENKAPIIADCYIHGKLLDATDGKIFLTTGTNKSFMSKTFLLNCLSLHFPPKFVSSTKNIFVGNGQYIGVLFFIPAVISFYNYTDLKYIHWSQRLMIA